MRKTKNIYCFCFSNPFESEPDSKKKEIGYFPISFFLRAREDSNPRHLGP